MCTQRHGFHFSLERTMWGIGIAVLIVAIGNVLTDKLNKCQIPTPNLSNPLPALNQ